MLTPGANSVSLNGGQRSGRWNTARSVISLPPLCIPSRVLAASKKALFKMSCADQADCQDAKPRPIRGSEPTE